MAASKCHIDSFPHSKQSIQLVNDEPIPRQIKSDRRLKLRRSRCGQSPEFSLYDHNENDNDDNDNNKNKFHRSEKMMTSKKSKRRSSTFSGDDDHVSPRRRSSVTFLLDDDDNDDDETPSRANPPICDRRAAASHSRFREQGRASRTYHNMERRQIQQTTTRRSSTNVVIKKSVDFPQKKRFSCGDVIGTEAKPDRFPSGNHPSKNIDIGRIGVGRQHAYQVGETLRPADQHYLIQPHTSCVKNKQGEDKEILQSISALKINDHAFIKRSNGQFTYAILAERKSNTSKSHDKQNNDDSMLFIISLKGHSKLIKSSRWLDLVLPLKGNNHETMTSECYSSGVSQRVLSSFSYMPSSTTSRLTKGKTTEEEVAGESDTIIITTAAPVDVETLD